MFFSAILLLIQMNTVEYFCAIFCIYIFLQYLHILYDICGQHFPLNLANEGGFDRKLLVERQFIFTTGWVCELLQKRCFCFSSLENLYLQLGGLVHIVNFFRYFCFSFFGNLYLQLGVFAFDPLKT